MKLNEKRFHLAAVQDLHKKKRDRRGPSNILIQAFVSLRWHYPNQVMGRSCKLPLSLSNKLPVFTKSSIKKKLGKVNCFIQKRVSRRIPDTLFRLEIKQLFFSWISVS